MSLSVRDLLLQFKIVLEYSLRFESIEEVGSAFDSHHPSMDIVVNREWVQSNDGTDASNLWIFRPNGVLEQLTCEGYFLLA